jgi:hypothetical protein
MPKSIDGIQTVPEGKARLNIIGFAGLSPVKEEKIFEQSTPFLNNPLYSIARIKLPVLKKRPSAINRIEVEVHGHGRFELELLEDMTAVIEETYNARFANMFFKTYIRTVLKNAAAVVAAATAGDQTGRAVANMAGNQVGGIIGSLVGISAAMAGTAVADASESADIRMGRFFPGKAYVGAIDLEPGTYAITVNFGNSVKEFKDVNVRAGRINLIKAVSLQ